ncbi:unnamed protein product [Lymnaea stagnalis]|uniref:CAP-Gly domain-containing protein n=1 Tax=Lymnaea stagnalis TaxID=6523 RepID=A0AAV2HQM1_LYMST
MSELAERQRRQAVKSAAVARAAGEGERKRKNDCRVTPKGNKDNIETMELDHEDDSTLTGDSEDESTPQATPRLMENETNKHWKTPRDHEAAADQSSKPHLNTTVTLAGNTAQDTTPGSRYIEFKGQKLSLDVDSVMDRFSQIVSHRRGQEVGSTLGSAGVGGGSRSALPNSFEFKLQSNSVFTGGHNPLGEETAFALGMSNSIARTNEERKQAIKATALTLQSRLAEGKRKLEDVNFHDAGQQGSPDFVSRFSRLIGNNNEYAVFTSNLPGSKPTASSNQTITPQQQAQAATRIQAAYRGHNVRQALNWELPSGRTLGHKLERSRQVKGYRHEDDDASELTETSTFSEITATEPSDDALPGADIPGNRRTQSSRHHRNEGSSRTKPTPATYKPPSQYAWVETQPDPYSVMSVFSRQSKYLAAGSLQADMPNRATVTSTSTTVTSTLSKANAAFITNLDLTSLKQQVITSTEHISVGKTSSGQPVVAKTRYTRLEAGVRERSAADHSNSDVSSSQSESASALPSKHSTSQHKAGHSSQHKAGHTSQHKAGHSSRSHDAGSKSEPVYTMTYESDEDEAHKPSHRTAASKKSHYSRQVSDAGVETDVSQMSEDEPRHMRSKLESAASRADAQAVAHDRVPVSASRGAGDGRLSPNSLANKFSANLNYLESMEESLRQVVGMERTRGISLAQQETVSLAQVLKARQQEHSAELRHLQLKAQKEAVDATQQLDTMRTRPGRHMAVEKSVTALLEKEDNLRPESRSHVLSSSRSSGLVASSTEDLSHSPGNQRTKRSSGVTTLASVSKGSSVSLTPSVKTAEDSRDNSDSSIKTASDVEGLDSQTASVPEEIAGEESYSMSFDETLTDEESFRQVLPSESHRKELRRQSGEFNASRNNDLSSSHVTPLGDLSSLFVGEDSFSKFTAEMVRQVMREEEYRAQHQAALLNLREKALQEKAKVELAWLQQLKQKPTNKGADDVFPNLDQRERKIRKNLQEQQAEIRRLQEANKMASKERQMLLQQHEEIAKIKHNTNATLQKLKSTPANGRLNRPFEVHTEDETEATSDVTEDIKESKSDSEMPNRRAQGDKKIMEKQQKMRLDQKYMTAREQKLHERKKQAKELLEWKKKLDAEEQKVYKLEKKAIEAWGGKNKERKKEEAPVKKSSKLVTPSKGDDSNVISNRMLSSIHDELDGAALRSRTVQSSISEVISTQLSMSESVTDKRSRSSIQEKDKQTSPGASGSESSIPEEIPSVEKQKAQDSGDDTIITSIANDDYADTFEHEGPSSVSNRRKSPVGKLLPQGNSPLPSPWSRKTGSESESEDSISHTETLSDVSDYEVRIRQLSDELRRRRKEVEILKKERSQRKKEIFKAKEEAMKKQLEAYNNYIQQLKVEKDELEHEPQFLRTAVKPQIKQPRVGHHTKPRPARKADDAASNSSSFEEMRDSPVSNQSSPSLDGKDAKLSPVDDKSKKKVAVSLMDRISEGSESDKSGASAQVKDAKKDSDHSEKTSSVQEMIEEVSQLDTNTSEKTGSDKLNIQIKDVEDGEKKGSEVDKDEDASYTYDFSDNYSSLAQSHSKVPLSARSQGSAKGPTDGDISEHIEAPSTARSVSGASNDKLDLKKETSGQDLETSLDKKSVSSPPVTPTESIASPPITGIQESDSDETESRVNSYQKSEGSSRPSSERSLGSNRSYPEEDEEEDIMSSGSERTPVMSSQRLLPNVVSATSLRTDDEDISEHISASLPSISEKRGHSASYRQDQDMLDSLLGFDEEAEDKDEDEKTPVATPREMAQTPVQEEEENMLLLTDPLADFQLGDRVIVWGRLPGQLRFKGKVEFSPGIWAGVELDTKAGESDGFHEGKRYFTCASGHGVMIPGSEIGAEKEKPDLINMEEIEEKFSPDESLSTDQEDSNVVDTVHKEENLLGDSIIHSTPVGSPYPVESNIEKPRGSPVKRDWTSIGESITDKLTATLVEDTLAAVGQVASKKSAPPTSPKPVRKLEPNVLVIKDSVESSQPPRRGQEDSQTSKDVSTDRTTDILMKSVLEEAIADMMNIRKRKAAAAKFRDLNAPSSLVNGHSESKELGLSFEDEREEDIQDNDSGLSLEPIQRPSSPVPGDGHSLHDRKALNDEMSELFGEYIDDDLGFEQSTNSLKPYTGNQVGLPDRTLVPEEIPPVVPLSKEELIPIISRAVDIFWENRRYGESLEGVAPPLDFLSDDDDRAEPLVIQSRRSWKRMLFDLTGEIIRDIYKNEDKMEPPPWQKARHTSQKFFKGANPPTTLDGLQPVVQAAVFNLLDVNGTKKSVSVNKWNIRKKKDVVDSVLSQELGEEEKGWVDYSQDELNLKMSLTDSLFDSLLLDTVQAVNGIYQRRQHSKV